MSESRPGFLIFFLVYRRTCNSVGRTLVRPRVRSRKRRNTPHTARPRCYMRAKGHLICKSKTTATEAATRTLTSAAVMHQRITSQVPPQLGDGCPCSHACPTDQSSVHEHLRQPPQPSGKIPQEGAVTQAFAKGRQCCSATNCLGRAAHQRAARLDPSAPH